MKKIITFVQITQAKDHLHDLPSEDTGHNI